MKGNGKETSDNIYNDGEEWESVAVFIVEYQKKVHREVKKQQFKTLVTQMDIEGDARFAEREWAGLQENAVCQWVGNRLANMFAAHHYRPENDEE